MPGPIQVWPRTHVAVAAGCAAMVCVGGSVAVSRTLIAAPLFTAQAIRYGVATLALLVLAASTRSRLPAPRGRDWLWLVGISVTGLVLFNVAIVRGVAHAEPAVLAVAVASVPVLLAVVGPLAVGQRPLRRLVTAAIGVTAGSALVIGTGRTDAAGIAWAVLAFACEGAFTLLAVPVLPRLGPWAVSVHSIWIASLILTILALLTEGPDAVLRLSGADWLAIAYLAVMVTAVAFVLWYSAVCRLGSGRAGLLTGIAPVSAAVVGMLSGAGLPRVTGWLGILIIAAAQMTGLSGSASPGETISG